MVAVRINIIQTAGQYGDSKAARLKRGTMRQCVYAYGQPAHDNHPCPSQLSCQFGSYRSAVSRDFPAAYYCDTGSFQQF
jgi:hypothetical protein